MKTIHFVSGLPRAGSTLLCNILAQNPKFHATATSGILDVLVSVRNQWDTLNEFKAMAHEGSERKKIAVLRGILNGYFADVDRSAVFDKSRGWLAYLELAEALLEREARVLVPVRDVREVLASFEMLYRNNIAYRQFAQEQNNYTQWQTVAGRCEIWCDQAQPVGLAYNRIKDALQRGFKERMHFVRFEDLTVNPERTMRSVYAFLDEPYYGHDFERVVQVTHEDDYVHGIPNLHTVRETVAPVPQRWRAVLGEVGMKYTGLELW